MKLRLIILGFCALLPISYAQAELSANLGLSNMYVKRGVKSSFNDSLIFSGGLDYQHPWGLYAGVFAYNKDTRKSDGWYEMNSYAGWSWGFQDVAVSAGIIRYDFATPVEGYDEYTASLGWKFLRFSTFQRDDNTESYYELEANAQFWDNMGMLFTVGLKDREERNSKGKLERKYYKNFRTAFVYAMESNVEFKTELSFTQEKKATLQDAWALQFIIARRFSLFDW